MFYVPVTAETWPRNLVSAAAKLFPGQLEPAECVVVEYCKANGLRRYLRQYERIHDVVSTWNSDQDNSFTILQRSPRHLKRLELSSVTHLKSSPSGFVFQLYYSTQPGIWNKYWVTLSESGLIFATNRPTSQPLDSDAIPLCHLSNCDVYKAGNKIKTEYQVPTMYCCVIKRQFPGGRIPNGESSNHLFSTNIQQLGERFFELVQRWRSWYLVRGKQDQTTTTSRPALSATPYIAGHQRSYPPTQPMQSEVPGQTTSSSELQLRSGLDLEHRSGAKPVPNDNFTPVQAVNAGESHVASPLYKNHPNSTSTPSEHNTTTQTTPAGEAGIVGSSTYDITKPETTLKSRPQPTQPTEKTEVQSWFPSAVEHTARTREVQKRPSVYRPRTATKAKAPINAKPKNVPPSRPPANGLVRKQVPRALQNKIIFDPVASLNQRPPLFGKPPRQAGKGKLPYNKSIGPPPLNLPRPGWPGVDQVYIPPLPVCSPRRMGIGTMPNRGHQAGSRVRC